MNATLNAAGAQAGAKATAPVTASTMATLAELAALLPGARVVGDPTTAVCRVHTDTRTLRTGDLFVALRGERFDAHDFLPQAAGAGAAAALAERGLAEAGLSGLEVPGVLLALQQLATAWRRRSSGPVIAVTGSNGKTTVTQMLAAILRAHAGDAALATAGNFNNHIGLPLTVLGLRPAHRIAVIEMGMNHPGEIATLAAIAQPTVALVNNAQREHQEFMATVAAVAEENGAAIEALPADGVAVFPADDAHAAVWQRQAGSRRVLRFALGAAALNAGSGQAADITFDAPPVWVPDVDGGHWAARLRTPTGTVSVAVHAPGRHNLHNALAAATAAYAAGVPCPAIFEGLDQFRPVKGRSQTRGLVLDGRLVTLIDDSYNANPDSVRAAIDLLAELPGPRWLVLGEMGEVGGQGPAFHAEVGRHAREAGLQALWTAGPAARDAASAFGPDARAFDDTAALIAALDERPACQAVLVKGSRYMRMETIVQALAGLHAPSAAPASGQEG